MNKLNFLIASTFIIISAMLTSCGIDEEDFFETETVTGGTTSEPDPSKWLPEDIGSFEIGYKDGLIFRYRNTSLFTIKVENGKLVVSSFFGNNVIPPRIKYLGTFDDLEEIPISLKNLPTEAKADLIDHGGYLIKLTANTPNRGNENYYLRLLIRNMDDLNLENGYVTVDYDIFIKNY